MLLILEYSYLYIEPDRDTLEGKFPFKQQYISLYYVPNGPNLEPYQYDCNVYLMSKLLLQPDLTSTLDGLKYLGVGY